MMKLPEENGGNISNTQIGKDFVWTTFAVEVNHRPENETKVCASSSRKSKIYPPPHTRKKL